MIAFLMGADAILFLTDKGGIYTEDPRENHRVKLYKEISAWANPKSIGISNGFSKTGAGGMIAKWREASRCAKKGMLVAIASNKKNVMLRFVKGASVGTKIGTSTKLKHD
jgi:glutamate 5-kinase